MRTARKSGPHAVSVVGVGQIPAEVGGENADGDDQPAAAEHGRRLSHKGPQPHAGQCSGQGGGGVDVFDEDVGCVPGHHVPQDAAAHAGDHPHEHQQEQRGPGRLLVGDADARHGEDAEPAESMISSTRS